ncbi:MAG: NDP-sugar synthase [Elusimicrobia bacterium]|nr:NDP-sugar synthase [Elusimicrobiota bacterium]
MIACLLAAGKSTRIASFSKGKPKPLLTIAEMPLIQHNLNLLERHGIREVWINLHHRPRQIRSAVQKIRLRNMRVFYSHEKKILGTAGAIKNLERRLSGGTFLVLYGDNYTDCNLKELVRQHRRENVLATIAVYHQGKNLSSGIVGGKVVLNRKKEVKSFLEGEKAPDSGSPYVNAGIYALEPSILNTIPAGFSDFGKDIFPLLIRQGIKISVYPMKGFCLAMDTPDAYQKAQQLVNKIGKK